MKRISMSKHEKHCLKYIRDMYGLKFLELGMIVKFKNDYGTVVGFYGSHILAVFVGNKKARILHPIWNMTYYDKHMNVL